MRFVVFILFGAVWTCASVGGCAVYPTGWGGADAECVPGQVEACRCDNSGYGERVCSDEGVWWGCACVCDGIWCDGVCTAYQTDADNCGSCGHACAAAQVCLTGYCMDEAPSNPCEDGQVPCDEACVNLDADPDNCGACGYECGAGCLCMMGTCAGDECG